VATFNFDMSIKKYLLFLLLGFLFVAPVAHAAIAFDNEKTSVYAASGVSTTTYTMGSGANGVLLVWNEDGGGGDPQTVTASGTALTKIIAGSGGAAFGISLWCLASPPTGSIIVKVSSTAQIYYSEISYTGVQSCTLDGSASSTGSATAGTNSITPSHTNTWMTSYAENESTASWTATSTPTGSVLRGNSGEFGDMSMVDSSGTIANGSAYKQGFTFSASTAYGIVSATLIPYAAAPAGPPNLDYQFAANLKLTGNAIFR
jgi:hypothetical protein